MPGYELREEQLAMARAVAEALEKEGVLLVEAGTGTGKSLAYLVPNLLWALRFGGPVIVSTRTLNLQQQLMEHDLPRLQEFLPEPPKVVMARGWSNYVCLRRLKHLPGSGEADPEIEQQSLELASLLDRGASGIRQHLQVHETLWSRVSADSAACSRQLCPHYGACYVFLERRQLEEADLVVTNHSLLLADLSLRQEGAPGILPKPRCLVLDEAHHLEDVASEHLGVSFSLQGFKRLSQQLYSEKSRQPEESGLLPGLRMRVPRGPLDPADRQRVLDHLDRELIIPSMDLYRGADEFFARLAGWFRQDEPKKLVTPEAMLEPEGQALREAGARLSGHLEQISQASSTLANMLRTLEWPEDGSVAELSGMADRLKSMQKALEFCLFPDSEDWVYWAQELISMGNRVDASLSATPLDVGERLGKELFGPSRSLVLTSATLSVGGELSFYEERVGLASQEERLQRLCLASPFDYRSQSYLGVATDLPEPGDPRFVERIAGPLAELVRTLGGRTFLLTTSYGMLRALWLRLEPELAQAGVECLLQGSESNALMLERFRSGGRYLLLGTDSFWEGVDVPGDALQCVVMARLPFRVPTDPVVQAHCKRLEDAGKSSFGQYQLPQAILRFRQGFGRLIRTTRDRGIVLVLDGRLYHRQYGQDFVRSLPGCTRRSGGLSRLVKDSLAWLSLSP